MPWEVVNPKLRRGPFRAAMFDFDGTLSLIREGWSGVMARLGLDLLQAQSLSIDPDEFDQLEAAMLRLSGKPSIFQMRNLADHVQSRGGTRPDPDELLQEFLRRLFATVGHRLDRLATGQDPATAWAVAGAEAILAELADRGVVLYLASGTDAEFVHRESGLLQFTKWFGARIDAPTNNTPHFSKRDVVEKILREQGIRGEELLGFGDGYAETVEVKRVGGVAVGLATVEAGKTGHHARKRDLLIELGADVIIPNYQSSSNLVAWLWNETPNPD